ncbi:Fur family transcriptional regulator [Desulforhopalus singaporensis]|uniref:Fur family transcriptional regulator, peroxide stress response regulator n=1 Tax=Desulforhopalus singaporensis TaxID=91360 RepID=A0A1H0TRQ6_9BACT|nr:Fur family transcriptional regulator [Desulforhopalus singaporensis]SDP56649.1 Fur family transcriptional regulator, peroxide stress response regulator [Desulforhopalus singaporensis]
MKIKQKEVEQRMDHFEAVCRAEGIKLTHQRIEIFREIAQAGDHPDADLVFRRVRNRIPTISLDTVYRTLWLLNDLGLVVTLITSRGRTRFDANLSRHHHFVCGRCGFTRDFYSDNLDNISLPESVATYGEVEATHVEVRGLCHRCAVK